MDLLPEAVCRSLPPQIRCGTYRSMRRATQATMVLAQTALLVASWSQPAEAREPNIVLDWEAPAGCPDADYVLDAARRHLSKSAGEVQPQDVAVRARIERHADRWQIHLAIRSDQTEGTRVITASSCQSLADAAAMIITLASVQDVELDQEEPPFEPNSGARSGDDTASDQPRRGPTRALHALATLRGAAIMGRHPSVALGADVAVGVRWGGVQVVALGELLPKQFSATEVPGARAAFRSYSGALHACQLWRTGNLGVGPCVRGEVVRIRGETEGSGVTSAPHALTSVEAWGGFQVSWTLGKLSVVSGAEAGMPMRRYEFVIANATSTEWEWRYRMAPVLGRLWLGVELGP